MSIVQFSRATFAATAAVALCIHASTACLATTPTAPLGPTHDVIPEPKAHPFRAFLDRDYEPVAQLRIADRRTAVAELTRAIYRGTGEQPLWLSSAGLSEHAEALLEQMQSAADDGLDPEAYQATRLHERVDALYARPDDDEALRFAIDRTITEALALFALHLARGQLRPKQFDWFIRQDEIELADLITDALRNGDFVHLRERLAPPFPEYGTLRTRLRHYRSVDAAGGWEYVPDGPKLEAGASDSRERIAALERRLLADGDLVDGVTEWGADGLDSKATRSEEAINQVLGDGSGMATYDARLADGVRHFQRRHGLGADGVVGPRTMRELNVTARDRARQVELNLERWRWMPRDIEHRHLRVNIPAFELALHDRDVQPTEHMPVVVGRKSWPTPVFSDAVGFLVLNPYWNVPKSIAETELMPKLRRDIEFLEREGYVLTDGQGRRIDPDPNDLGRISHRTHFLRQLPGPGNALGRVKFIFPNEHDVYLHDTPSRGLFRRAERAFSHGCIRVERPFDLVEYLVRDDPQWTMARIEKLLDSGPDRWARLAQRVPIYITYFTAAVDATGAPVFYPDIYGIDANIAAALEAARSKPPRTATGAAVARIDLH